MLCSWGRFFVVLVCSLTFCANGFAASNQRLQAPDRYHWSFLGFHIETSPPESILAPKPIGPPECELGATWESAQEPFGVFEDQGDQIRLDPIEALEMPVDVELESAYQDQFAQPSPNAEQSVIDEFAPVTFPNNGCDFGCYPSLEMTASDSTSKAPSIPESTSLPSIKMDFQHWIPYRVAQASSDLSTGCLEMLNWDGARLIEIPIDPPALPEMDSELISGPVPPADVECPWSIAPADLIAREVEQNQEKADLPIATEEEFSPTPIVNSEHEDLEIAEKAEPEERAFSKLFHQASSRSVSELPLPVESKTPSSQQPIIQSAPQMSPSIHLPEVKKNARPITLVFQFNTIQQSPATPERQNTNDRIVGSGISVGHQTPIDEDEIFDAEEIVDQDAAYWEHYSFLGEMGITFPLAENEEPAPRRMIPARSASNAFVIPDPQPAEVVLTWAEIQQIPGYAYSQYRGFVESSFFSNPELWMMETCYRIECELCGTRLLAVWHYVLDTVEENQQKMRMMDEIEARQKEAQRLRYVALQVDRLSRILDSGARQLTYWALESEGSASARLSTENKNR